MTRPSTPPAVRAASYQVLALAALGHTPPSVAAEAAPLPAFHARVTAGDVDATRATLTRALRARSALERAVAAHALAMLTHGADPTARAASELAARSPSRAVAEIGRTALAQIALLTGEHRPLPPVVAPADSPPGLTDRDAPASVSITLHGTWGADPRPSWYRPGESLHAHIRAGLSPELYAAADYPRWSGDYSDAARDAGARDLTAWVHAHTRADHLTSVYAHSHGGTVALTALTRGLRVDTLVLLHTPPRARPAAEWERIRANVRRVLVYRVPLDRIVMMDLLFAGAGGGAVLGQRFDPRTLPHHEVAVMPPRPEDWFTHDYYTRVDVWRARDVDEDVRRYRAVSAPR